MESNPVEASLQGLDPIWLAGLVAQDLRRPAVALDAWRYERISAGRGAATAGLFRLAGTAHDGGQRLAWSLILKVLSPAPPASEDVSHPLYWRREALAFGSGLLADLPGYLRAVRCYAVVDQPGGSCWLWLEDAQDTYGYAWPLAAYRRAANALGQFNGAYLAQRGLPDHPWLARDTSPRGVLNAYAWVRDLAADPAVWRSPPVADAFPRVLAGRLLRLWDERARLLAVVEAMPYTLCHGDAWRGNLFASRPAGPAGQLVAIDWAYVGRGPVGADAGDLLAPGFGLCAVQADRLAAVERAVCEGYLAGLRRAGWDGDPAQVRRAVIAFAGAKYGCLQLWLDALHDEAAQAAWAAACHHSFTEFVFRQAAMLSGLFALLDEVGLKL